MRAPIPLLAPVTIATLSRKLLAHVADIRAFSGEVDTGSP
jgi:hypothetical protein